MADPIEPNPDFLSGIKTYDSCLGKGGFGIVLKAIDTSDTPTAIKFIFHQIYRDEDRQKLLREYSVTKNLEQHPNIVKSIGVQEEKTFSAAKIEEVLKDIPIPSIDEIRAHIAYITRPNAHYSNRLESICIQMELCGENLRKWLKEKHNATDLHIKFRQTRIIQGMISGLKYLHENKIIHRDLKPENIMFSKGRYYQLPVKIGDFGLSRRIHSDVTNTGPLTTGVGTTIYMAPEVNRGDYDQQADLYSLGLIIWEVAQLIGTKNIKHLFDSLVNDKDEELVQDHAMMTGVKEIIIRLTKRKTAERTKTLNDIQIDNWDKELNGSTLLYESISNCEKNWTVKTSQELKLCLDNAQPGCIINLMGGEYLGPFLVRQDFVQIIGSGEGTVMRNDGKNCFEILGSGCTISNVKIIRSDSGIIIHGSQNTIKQVEFDDMKEGVAIFGDQTTVDEVTMTNVEDTGIVINSGENSISNITGLAVHGGILVGGPNNNLTNINFQRGTPTPDREWPSIGVSLSINSSHIKISNLTCTGYSRDNETWGLCLGFLSSNCTVIDSVCGPVQVLQSKNLTLTNVDCGEFITVRQSEGVELINCRGKKLEAPETVKVSPCCQFEEMMLSLSLPFF